MFRKTFRKKGIMCRKYRTVEAEHAGDHTPAHLPALNPGKALAKWMGRRGLADTGLDPGSAA